MPMPSMPKAPPPKPIRGLLPLRAMERYPMPVEQRAAVSAVRPDALATALSDALSFGGFTPAPLAGESRASVPPSLVAGRTQYAERNVRRVPTHTAMRVSMGVIVGAGISLGAVDGVLVGGIWYTFPWFLGGVAGAGLLWWRYGRTYESEVLAVRFSGRPAPGTPPAGPLATPVTGTVLWSAGRVRSVLFAGVRTAVGVLDCPIPLMESLGGVVRRFETEFGTGVPTPSGTGPAP